MQPKSTLTLVYYLVMIITLVAAMIGYRLAIISNIYLEPQSEGATIIYTFVLLYVLLSVPFGLKNFHQKVKKIRTLPNDGSREKAYTKYGIIRLSLIGLGLILSVLAYFFLRQKSLFWLAGITAIALIFCRPNPSKIEADLNPEAKEEIPEASPQDQTKEENDTTGTKA